MMVTMNYAIVYRWHTTPLLAQIMTSWDSIYEYAERAGAKFPECVAAQWALESGYGKHLSGRNNFFGIKGTPGTTVSTQEWVGGKFITIRDTFKDFNTPYDCVKYLVDRWYKDFQGYRGVNRAVDRNACARLLKEEGYATDPNYFHKLIDIMDANQVEEEMNESFLERAAFYYKSLKHQKGAWRDLEATLDPGVLERFKEAYRGSQEPQEVSASPITSKFPLMVQYEYQRDSSTWMGERMCFSSSMAMALEYVDPEKLSGDDDDYLEIVLRHGDTVSSNAQLAAAKSLGYDLEFKTNTSEKDLIEHLDMGIPVPIGVLHKGNVNHPVGGGHWICLTGYTDTHFWCCDPFGEMDLVNGGYVDKGPQAGNQIKYSRKNLMKRFLINSKSDGWAMFIYS